MAFSTPYETDQYIVYSAERITIKLSFAVKLIDDFTKKETIGSIKVKIKEMDKKAIKNPSGYYLFTDLKAGNYTVSIDSDFYFPQEATVDIASIPDKKNPIIEIALIPRPVYPFSQNATLIRGVVKDGENSPVKGAQLKVIGRNMETTSDENGSFVVYLGGIENEEEVSIESKKMILPEQLTLLQKSSRVFQRVSSRCPDGILI